MALPGIVLVRRCDYERRRVLKRRAGAQQQPRHCDGLQHSSHGSSAQRRWQPRYNVSDFHVAFIYQ